MTVLLTFFNILSIVAFITAAVFQVAILVKVLHMEATRQYYQLNSKFFRPLFVMILTGAWLYSVWHHGMLF